MRKFVIFSIASLFLACADNGKSSESAIASEEAEVEKLQQEQTANSALIPTVDFEEFDSKYLQNKNDTTYVINFWATWCKPCVKELPAFEKLNEQYSDQKVKIILVSLDFPDKIVKQVIPFIKKHNLQSEVILLDDPDSNSWIPKVSQEWSGAIPATIIYNQKDRKFYEGSFTYEGLKTELLSNL